uniref:Uncharacterized protein n=2 Tax=Micrurus TaxID=8634 RepID=A0A2D4EW17_MICCO
MDLSLENLKATIEDFKAQHPDQFQGSVYEIAQKEILKREKDWLEKEENERGVLPSAIKENKEDILNLRNVIKKKRVKYARMVVKRNIRINLILKRKQNFGGKKRGELQVAGKVDKGNNRMGEERQRRQGGKKSGGRGQRKGRYKKWIQWAGLLNMDPIMVFSAHKDTG